MTKHVGPAAPATFAKRGRHNCTCTRAHRGQRSIGRRITLEFSQFDQISALPAQVLDVGKLGEQDLALAAGSRLSHAWPAGHDELPQPPGPTRSGDDIRGDFRAQLRRDEVDLGEESLHFSAA